jgi:hypothetical protein
MILASGLAKGRLAGSSAAEPMSLTKARRPAWFRMALPWHAAGAVCDTTLTESQTLPVPSACCGRKHTLQPPGWRQARSRVGHDNPAAGPIEIALNRASSDGRGISGSKPRSPSTTRNEPSQFIGYPAWRKCPSFRYTARRRRRLSAGIPELWQLVFKMATFIASWFGTWLQMHNVGFLASIQAK